MELRLRETCRGVSVELTVQIAPQALGYPDAGAQSDATPWHERIPEMDECLDSVRIELLERLRQARLLAERSLVVFSARQLQERVERGGA